jgi:hypothetical protein
MKEQPRGDNFNETLVGLVWMESTIPRIVNIYQLSVAMKPDR